MAKLCMQILYLKWIVNRKEWNDNFDGLDKPQNSNDGNYRLLKMIGIYSATCRKCTLLRHTATALFNNDNNCKGLIWESYLIWAKQPMIQQSPDLVTVDLVKNLDLVKFSLLTEFLWSKNCRFSEDLETLEPRFSEVFSEFSKKNWCFLPFFCHFSMFFGGSFFEIFSWCAHFKSIT